MQTPLLSIKQSKNRFLQIKKYLHCADNQNLDLSDKLAKIQSICDLINISIKQFFFWKKDFFIDENMIPHFARIKNFWINPEFRICYVGRFILRILVFEKYFK